MKSTAARRAAAITFTATIAPTLTTAATDAHSALTPDALVQHISNVNDAMGLSVAVPTVAQVTGTPVMPTAAPTAAPTGSPTTAAPTAAPTASNTEDEDKGNRTAAAIIVSMVVLGAIGAYFICFDRAAITGGIGASSAAAATPQVSEEDLKANVEMKEEVPDARSCC